MNDHDGGLGYLTRTRPTAAKPSANAIVRILSVLARNRSSEQVDAPSATVFIVGVPTKPRGSEIPLAVSAVREGLLRVFPEESPDIEVLDSAIPVDEVPGSTLAKANEDQAIPVEAAGLGTSSEVLKVIDRDFSEPVKMMLSNRFPRPLRDRIRGGLFVFGHQSLPACERNSSQQFKISPGRAVGIGPRVGSECLDPPPRALNWSGRNETDARRERSLRTALGARLRGVRRAGFRPVTGSRQASKPALAM